MKAKILVYALPALILTTIHLAMAQQAAKVPRIGFLVPGSQSAYSTHIEAFRQGLLDLGYTEGKTSRLSTDTPKTISIHLPLNWSALRLM
jgi:hypothetical protein